MKEHTILDSLKERTINDNELNELLQGEELRL